MGTVTSRVRLEVVSDQAAVCPLAGTFEMVPVKVLSGAMPKESTMTFSMRMVRVAVCAPARVRTAPRARASAQGRTRMTRRREAWGATGALRVRSAHEPVRRSRPSLDALPRGACPEAAGLWPQWMNGVKGGRGRVYYKLGVTSWEPSGGEPTTPLPGARALVSWAAGMRPGDIVTHAEMCQAEQTGMLQRGMYYREPPNHGVILMSLRPDAPYADAVEPDGTIWYEGHDAPRAADRRQTRSGVTSPGLRPPAP
ncbi:MAG: hypothetical protein KatS3mg064_1166 [Tepidiforma sp.]|nr:MAG: hypothetical protein KatS3mg064_1166 [Tepidiforma sp.]